jgi:ADP-ribose pyrophosphatase YjhB (NUDIX family)
MFNHCPNCGHTPLTTKSFQLQHCPQCDSNWYQNPKAAGAAILVDQHGRVGLITRATEPGKGSLDLVGGFVDLGETAEQATVREIKEELGVQIAESQLQALVTATTRYAYQTQNYHTLEVTFVTHVSDDIIDSMKPSDDVADITWFTIQDIPWERLTLEGSAYALRTYVERL